MWWLAGNSFPMPQNERHIYQTARFLARTSLDSTARCRFGALIINLTRRSSLSDFMDGLKYNVSDQECLCARGLFKINLNSLHRSRVDSNSAACLKYSQQNHACPRNNSRNNVQSHMHGSKV